MSAWRRAAVPARARERAGITTSSTATRGTGPSGLLPVCRSSCGRWSSRWSASPTLLGDVFSSAALENWGTVFLSLTLQAVPFLVLGVIVSAAISAFVPAERLAALVPRRPGVAVPAAGLAGAVLPGCECRARGWPRTRTPAPVVSSLRRVDQPREPYEYPT